MLTIGREQLECDSFRVRGSYGKTIARLFALPVAVESTEPLTLEVTLKGNFRPPKIKRRVYWAKKFIGNFLIASVAQEWEGDKYRTRLELKQCDRNDTPDDEIPNFKWRHDLVALANNLPETDGALIAAGRDINPFAKSWKLAGDSVDAAENDNPNPAVLPVSLGGTGSSDPRIALLNLGGISSANIGLPYGVAPLGADGKVPSTYLPPGSGGGGSSVVFPITVAQGGTNALDAATARTNLGAIGTAELAAAIAPKADTTAVNSALALKADASAVSAALALKADTSAVAAALALKVDTSTYTAGLGLKVDTTTYTAGLALKADLTALTAGLGLKVDTTTYTAGLALKLDASARNAANGVAPLDVNSLLPIANIPLNTFFPFTAGVSFRGGATIPAATTTLVQSGVDGSGQPVMWLVNASASAGNRIKSITIASNGNIRFTHYADDGTAGNVLEHTASGNILTNGTVRPGSGSAAFTGASFVPGSTYFRTDILVGGSATGANTFSDGFEWLAMFGKGLTHLTSPNLDNLSNGWISCDTSSVDGVSRGWHVCTSYRPNSTSFAVQFAFCDTTNGFRYRRKASGTWQAWATII